MVTLLFGARQVGKTTLLHAFEKDIDKKVRFINADELKYQDVLSSQDSKTLGSLLEDNDILIIDEAQRIENIGLNLKIMVDSFPESVIIASGSASFDLANKVSEPLTGRKITFTPLSCQLLGIGTDFRQIRSSHKPGTTVDLGQLSGNHSGGKR